jgi:DNA-binding transcriptional MocR family regulator
VKFICPQGGFFIWLELPHSINATELSKEALNMNINFKPGVFFSCEERFANCIRLCFTFYSEDKLQFACEQLGKLLHKYI